MMTKGTVTLRKYRHFTFLIKILNYNYLLRSNKPNFSYTQFSSEKNNIKLKNMHCKMNEIEDCVEKI